MALVQASGGTPCVLSGAARHVIVLPSISDAEATAIPNAEPWADRHLVGTVADVPPAHPSRFQGGARPPALLRNPLGLRAARLGGLLEGAAGVDAGQVGAVVA